MVPWPIALLTLFFGVIAAASGATAWKVLNGASERSLTWAVAWLALSIAIACGLPLLKRWARRLAVIGTWGLALMTLAVSAFLILSGRPLAALGSTLATVVYLVVIRYLGRPSVKTYFTSEKNTSEKNVSEVR